jgi:hypothetical protein
MEKKIETLEIVAKDSYGDNCLNDGFNTGNRGLDKKPTGFVEIYEVQDDGNKKLIGKHNLVLYIGREWLAQVLVRTNNPNITSTYDEYLTWFGLGDGGVIPGDPLNPSPPVLTDTSLSSDVMITATDSSAADYRIVPEVGFYKIPFDSIDFEQDVLNDDKWLVIRIVTTVGATYANGKQLSEAALFTAASSIGGYSGNFTIFSRVTFPSIVKTEDRRLIFTWYLYV